MSAAQRRVVITRPRQQAEPFGAALAGSGIQPVYFPTIRIAPSQDTLAFDRALQGLACYDWLVVTSANAVNIMLERLGVLELPGLPEGVQVAAVGPKTAAALAEHGIQPDFVPESYLGEAIVPGLGDLHERWVLLPTADIAHDDLPQAIEAAGGVAHVIVAYHTLPEQVDAEGLAMLNSGVDAIAFTSGSTVHNFIALLRQVGLDPFDLRGKPKIACIGPKTAQAAEEAGYPVDILADEYTVDGLAAAILDHFNHMV